MLEQFVLLALRNFTTSVVSYRADRRRRINGALGADLDWLQDEFGYEIDGEGGLRPPPVYRRDITESDRVRFDAIAARLKEAELEFDRERIDTVAFPPGYHRPNGDLRIITPEDVLKRAQAALTDHYVVHNRRPGPLALETYRDTREDALVFKDIIPDLLVRLPEDLNPIEGLRWVEEIFKSVVQAISGLSSNVALTQPGVIDKGAALDQRDPVEELRRAGRATPARLVEFMKDRRSAEFNDIAEYVHYDECAEPSTIRQNIKRTNDLLMELGFHFEFVTRDSRVFKRDVSKGYPSP